MIILIPLGGTGSRFKENGYSKPKALINALGKPILYWLLDSLDNKSIDYIYVPYNMEYKKYRLEDQLRKDYPNLNFKFFALKENTRGAAETIHIALEDLINKNISDKQVLCLDGDNFYSKDIVSLWGGRNGVVTFNDQTKSSSPIYSFVSVGEDLKITNIAEKEKISDLACSGAYGFDSFYSLNKYCKRIISNNIKDRNEFYTSTVIKEMINDGIDFDVIKIYKSDFTCLGTPLQLRLFCNKSNSSFTEKRYCFDLDNTLVTFPKEAGDYSSVDPIEENIEFVRYLKELGHEIIIYSARRMKTHGGTTGKSLADIGEVTLDTIKKFEIPFDEIHLNKPYANYYIDDLALHTSSDLEKELGFYNSEVEPREFNNLNSSSIDIYRKRSGDLSGEIFYYENLPLNLKDMFPVLIRRDENNKWYDIEKINGIPANKLFLSETLSKTNLIHILDSIKRIQETEIKEQNVNIYDNYSRKMEERYASYDYSRFAKSDKVYENINKELKAYEEQGKGKVSFIHGDPVLTNIIMNEFGRIKFIDMRGKQGDTLTCSGDWLYDWAKLYQSLIGYDEILENKFVSNNYKQRLIKYFKKYFLENFSREDFENLKVITKSLLYTLIPLHDNEKCKEYYNLINSHYLKPNNKSID